jgi:hypothetical protein
VAFKSALSIPRDIAEACASGMRRFTLPELSGVELHEVAHVRRSFAGELAQCVRHTVVTSLPRQLGHCREMADEVLGKPRLPKAFAPRREWDVAISDGPAERLGEDARIILQVDRFRPREVVYLSDMRCGIVKDHCYRTPTSTAEIGEVLPPPIGSANSLDA